VTFLWSYNRSLTRQFAKLTKSFAVPILTGNNENDLPFRVLLIDGKSVVGGFTHAR
jgi:hypothetical protein